MRFFMVTVAFSMACNAILGLVIFLINPKRRVNRCFFILSLSILLWLGTLLAGSLAHDLDILLLWIRAASSVAAMLPLAYDLVRIGIVHPTRSWRSLFPELLPWLLAQVPILWLCQTDFFVYDCAPGPTGFVHAIYGPGHFVFIGYWLFALALMVHRFWRDARRSSGTIRTELGYMVVASATSVSVAVLFAHLLPYLTGNLSTPQLAPFLATIFTMGIVGYGIATKRIMSVGRVLQRVTAYLMLALYLGALYFGIYELMQLILGNVGWNVTFLPGLIASIVVAFSVVPVRGWMQRVVRRLFGSGTSMDVAEMMRQAHDAVYSFGTMEELAATFAGIIRRAAGPTHLSILIQGAGPYAAVYTDDTHENPDLTLPAESPVISLLKRPNEVASLAVLRRSRPTELRSAVVTELTRMHVDVAMGVHAQGELAGVVLLGGRLSGQIYSAEELDALQIISDQLAVAIENSRLYTQVQDARIYHEALIRSLGSGIAAVDASGTVTVFNREAERITGLSQSDLIGRDHSQLPEPLASRLGQMLRTGVALPEEENSIPSVGRDAVPVRLGGSVFEGHRGGLLGVLLAFQDIGLLRRLEEQIRRNDRLSSLGTLSAGMAHEIKNPLVTIKTFAQLLPERHGDEEFRRTFFDLVGQEVSRIDSIVNRLLNFARPAKAELQPLHLHEVVDNALKLVEHPLRAKRISQVLDLAAPNDWVRGDKELLVQVLINLFLNAVEAMPGEGTLRVSSRAAHVLAVHEETHHGGAPAPAVRLSVQDTGRGIDPADLPHIFDPFFTRTSSGTGLGLSIVHGIIQEHLAMIEVESKVGEGTTFHILIPICDEQEEQV